MDSTKELLQIELEFFAVLKDLLTDSFIIDVEKNIKVIELKKKLMEMFPQAKEFLEYSRFALENEILSDDVILNKNQKIYVLPPSSGG